MIKYEIAPELMKGLLQFVVPAMAPACPYAFVMKDAKPAPLAPYVDWLRTQGVLTFEPTASPTDPTMEGWEWDSEFLKALNIIAQPRHRIRFLEAGPEETGGALYVTNGRDVVLAQLSKESCVISTPQSMTGFIEKILLQLEATDDSDNPLAPIRTDHKVVRVIGALAGGGLQALGSERSITTEQFKEILLPLLEDKELVVHLLQDLEKDQFLVQEAEQIWIHPQFVPYTRAIQTGVQLEIYRVDLPNGEVPTDETPSDRILFLGPKDQRCLILATKDGSHEVIMGRPSSTDLKVLLAEVLGDTNLDNASIDKASAWSRGQSIFFG